MSKPTTPAVSATQNGNSSTGPADHAAVSMREVTPQGAQRRLDARLYTPMASSGTALGLIVFFHHGGFVAGNPDEVDDFVRALAARTRHQVLSSSYTLAGEHPFPAAVEDAHAVIAWVAKHHRKIGWDGVQLIVAGIEAGGNLAAVASLMARDRGGPSLAAQILIMPMLDPGLTTCSMRSLAPEPGMEGLADACAEGYHGYLQRAADRIHPYASPLQSSRLKGLPPALVLSAEDDPLRDEAEQYGAKLIACGIKTQITRLSPLRVQDQDLDQDARCDCAHQESALNEIAAFIAGLDSPQKIT